MLLTESLAHAVKVRPHHVAVVDDSVALTYRELRDRVRRLANALRDGLGLEVGERFGLLATNRAEFVEAYYAAAEARLVCVPLNHRLAPPELAGIMGDAATRVLIAEPGLGEKVEAMRAEGFDGEVVRLAAAAAGDSQYEALLAQASDAPRGEPIAASDPTLQIYTSGTTGFPKGVMLSHRTTIANCWHMLAEAATTRDDRHLTTMPLCHLGAGSRIFLNVHAAATHVIHSRFDPERTIAVLGDGSANTALIVPAMLRELLAAGARQGAALHGKVRQLIYGAAPMPQDVLAEALELLGCDFQQTYGLTEAGPNLTVLPPEDHRPDASGAYPPRLASVGRQTIGVEVRVVGDDDERLPPGEIGEIVARGPNVMEGYWRQPEATAETLRGGWLRTGDLGVRDEHDYVYLVDRKKDMLISGGFNVYPREIERALEQHTEVSEIAVVGTPDDRWGEVPAAFVVAVAGARPARLESELRALSDARLARFKAPKHYLFVEELPRNAAGKVLKRELSLNGAQTSCAPRQANVPPSIR